MARITSWTISGADNEPIFGNTHFPDADPIGTLILCHGFKGYKDYGFFPHLAQAAAQRGLHTIRFNFSHSGMTDKIETFERPDMFERDTWGKQAIDLAIVCDECWGDNKSYDNKKIIPYHEYREPFVWFGHSRGAVTALVKAAATFDWEFYFPAVRGGYQPSAVILAATPHSACSLTDEQRDQLRRDGFLETVSSRTGQVLRIGREWLSEIEAQPDQFDPLLAAAFIKCPALFIHGSADETVSVESSHMLAQAATPHATLQIIDGANHTFGAPNPLPLDAEPPAVTKRFIDIVCDFAVGALREKR